MSRDSIIDLSKAGNADEIRSRSKFFELIWMICEFIFVFNPLQLSSGLRVFIIRIFGGQIGRGVIFRQRTKIKYPWKLKIGDNCWIGEEVWIHNQDNVTIGNNVVISQGTFITTGSHDIYIDMKLITRPINIEDGVWITSKCIILMGSHIGSGCIVTPGSVVRNSLEKNSIYGGNPLKFIKLRVK
ncbi:colanic acid biosynthesis acetyltransferase WcaF [Deinococcus indicus]|uniref:DapH/DapD/GlmU-related protein n=1 Tax=Deinococcus indicus TaxID=223556 RepID=UPI00174A93FE|nr:DapH/DapD/GlmU-related protein [Deinococcus indicus]GHG27626.1 colanic acid biosynthesis acetyltransferase WcaF [Deinococcus indicus]